MIKVSPGKTVSIEYTLKLHDQTILYSNVGNQPLTYSHGSNKIIPALEKGIEGMSIGEKREIQIEPEQGYGSIDPDAFFEMDKQQFPPELLRVGAEIQTQDQHGRDLYARVAEIKDETVVLDFNHPLAGKTLYVEVKVLEIQ